MQRQNNLLKTTPKRRSAFAIIMAMAVIVVIGTIMALSLALTTETSKKTTDIYLYEQAVLLSKSAAEVALLRIAQDNNISNPTAVGAHPCTVTNLNFNHENIYNVNVDIRYAYSSPPLACAGSLYATYTTPVGFTPDSNGTVLMDITVSTLPGVATEPIRYFRRSIQKL